MATWSEDDERRVGRALAAARTHLRAVQTIEPTGPEIIFQVIKDAVVDVERRMRLMAREPKPLRGALIDYIHDANDWPDILKRCFIDEAAGDAPEFVWGWTPITVPGEVETMEAVERIFRSCQVGKNQLRDWKILLALGGRTKKTGRNGRPVTSSGVAKGFHVTKQRVHDIKEMQCASIWRGVRDLIPQIAGGGGKIWREAA